MRRKCLVVDKAEPYLSGVQLWDRSQIAAYKTAFQARNEQINGGLQLQHFNSFLLWFLHIRLCGLPYWLHPHLPRASIFLLRRPRDETIIGVITIRRTNSRFFLKHGGHIGYSICPSERNQGYGTTILSLALEKCRGFGMRQVELICSESNIFSRKVIENNGGVFHHQDGQKQLFLIRL